MRPEVLLLYMNCRGQCHSVALLVEVKSKSKIIQSVFGREVDSIEKITNLHWPISFRIQEHQSILPQPVLYSLQE